MTDMATDAEIKACCATFYQSDLVGILLGGVFHPGGLALTHHLGERIRLESGLRALDVACGRGASAVHLAQRFGCHITGLDYSEESIVAATAHAAQEGVSQLTSFLRGDAERLPFEDGALDAVISECSFCTFPDKVAAAAEMARVLRSGGRLGMTDMTVDGPLPQDIQSLLAWVACVAGAGTPRGYATALQAAGFADVAVEDQRDALLDMVRDVRRKLLGLELAAGLGRLPLEGMNLDEAKRLARCAHGLIEDEVIGYALITARKA